MNVVADAVANPRRRNRETSTSAADPRRLACQMNIATSAAPAATPAMTRGLTAVPWLASSDLQNREEAMAGAGRTSPSRSSMGAAGGRAGGRDGEAAEPAG